MEVSGMEPVSTGRRRRRSDGTGKLYTGDCGFPEYVCEQSIADHSAYLLGAMNGKKKEICGTG